MIESHPPRGVGSRFLHPLAIASVCVTFATCVTCLICPTGATAAGLQIKGLSDPRGPVAGRSQSRAPLRVSDGFCVISEARAAVQLAFSNSHGPAGDGRSWIARNEAGMPFSYLQFVSNADLTDEVQVSSPGRSTFVVTAGHALAGPDCGRGNVVKSVVPTHEAGPAGSGNFTDVVTVVASPL
ncbi:MAG: hypothetical protein EOP73_03130 [Variovorax sp.]|nr:MAG: hypothetical protein EOP73_03130 [Variovorax sp.]